MINYGEGGSFAVQMDGPFSGSSGGGSSKLTTISAPAASWKGATSPYSQVVQVDGISIASKVDLQLSLEYMEHLHDRVITFFTENDTGIVTLYAIGDRPDIDLEFQAVLTEVTA